jgi:hypothetical protein
MEMDMETDMEMEIDMKTETETDSTQTLIWNCGTFAKYLIRCKSPYGAVSTASDISRSNFQQRYILLAPFHEEKIYMQIFRTTTGIAIWPMC